MELRDQLQKTLGDAYTLERELAGGGMARVFVAHERTLGRRVVIKTLAADFVGAVSAERFRREIRLAASLQQANIVPVHSAGEVDGLPYYTMPFVEGESLRARLAARGALPVREAVGVLRDVARALSFAHERGVVHRDIKPENVLLSGSTAVVTDFGIAKAIEAAHTNPDAATLTHLGTALGTPAYISPEQAAGDPGVDHRADIYALGVVAYELLVGAPPFAGRTAQALMAAHISERPAALGERCRDAPPALVTLVMRCLEKDPASRPQSAAEVLELLDAASTPSHAPAPATAPAKPVIAVLPLANLSASADDEYFSDGMTEDIIAQLSQIASLNVISRTSVMRYKKTEKNAKEIAADLSATHIVEGSVRRAGNRLRIVAQLIEAASDTHLWAETFDRDLTDMFAIQSEVAERIAGVLRAKLGADTRARFRRRPTEDMEAYNLFLLGRHHYHHWDDAQPFAKAIEYFQRAIDRDPRFARAHAALALPYLWHGAGYFGMRPRDAYAKAIPLASRAIELDDTVAEAHVVLAMHQHNIRFDWDAAQAHFERALTLNPSSADAHLSYGWHLVSVNRMDEALEAALRAIELDPASATVRGQAAHNMLLARRLEQALDTLRAAEAQMPNDVFLLNIRTLVLIALERAKEAVPLAREVAKRLPVTAFTTTLAWALAAAGEQAEAREILRDVVSREATEYVYPTTVAIVFGCLGEMDRAFEYLERAYEDRAGWMAHVGCSPHFDLFRGDPRFDAIGKRVGAIPSATR